MHIHEDIHKPGQDFKISPELASPIHQHLFNVRIDWDLDDGDNQLFETNVEPLPINNTRIQKELNFKLFHRI